MIEGELQTNRLQALAESAQLFAEASTDLPRLLGVVARRFSELVGEAVNIRLIEGDALVPVATHHPDSEINEYLREFHDQAPLKVGEGISGKVLESGEPYFMPQLDLEQLKLSIAPRFVPIFEKIGVTGMIVARLRARGINLGYLSLFRTGHARPPYTQEDLHLVRDLADRAALAIDNSRLVDGLERRVAERTEALEAANLELDAFTSSVSHDLQAPLRSIDGFAQMLEEDYGPKLDDEGRRIIAVVRRNARHMRDLIDDLLRLSKLGHRALEPVTEIAMGGLVEAVIESMRAAKPALVVEVVVGELPSAPGNVELVKQVWVNLLDNAVKYSRRAPHPVVRVSGEREGSEVRYTVSDNGVGFDPKKAETLFRVFQRLHSQSEFEGTGVGLALVQRIVTRHGGRVWAEGQVDGGATFGFALPSTGLRDPAR